MEEELNSYNEDMRMIIYFVRSWKRGECVMGKVETWYYWKDEYGIYEISSSSSCKF